MVAVNDRTRHDKIAKHYDFDLTYNVIGDLEVNNIERPSIHFPDLSNAV